MSENKTLCKQSYLLGYADGRENKWIKCEEQMPDKDGRYLVVEVFSGNDKWIGVSSLRNGVWDCLKVKYWQELPEAPAEVKDEQ